MCSQGLTFPGAVVCFTMSKSEMWRFGHLFGLFSFSIQYDNSEHSCQDITQLKVKYHNSCMVCSSPNATHCIAQCTHNLLRCGKPLIRPTQSLKRIAQNSYYGKSAPGKRCAAHQHRSIKGPGRGVGAHPGPGLFINKVPHIQNSKFASLNRTIPVMFSSCETRSLAPSAANPANSSITKASKSIIATPIEVLFGSA